MSGVLRLGNTGAGTGRSTLEASASNDQTFTLPSAGGTILTTDFDTVGDITWNGSNINITNADLNVDNGTLFVDESTNQVGIGTTSPAYKCDIDVTNSALRLNSTTTAATLVISSDDSAQARIEFGDETDNDRGALIYDNPDNALIFQVNTAERVRIDSSGRLLVGTSSVTSIPATLNVIGGNNTVMHTQGTNADSPFLFLSHARGTGTQSVNAQDGVGAVAFVGYDGTNALTAARIEAFVDGAPGANDMPGRLVFSTTGDGNSTTSTRLTINSQGKSVFNFVTQAPSGAATNAGQVIFDQGDSSLAFGIDATLSNRACWLQGRHPAGSFDNLRYGIALNPLGGGVTIGSLQPRVGNVNEITDSSADTTLLVTKQGNNSNSLVAAIYNDDIAGDNKFIGFFTENTAIGRGNITFNRSAGTVSYGTTSDARLKRNITDSPVATIKLNQIQVRSFNWNEKGFDKTEYGFIAQELNTIFPGAVIEGDNEENIIKQWEIDNSKLVPLITKALQETIAKVEALEAEVSRLRSN